MSPAFDVPVSRNHALDRPRLSEQLGTGDKRANLTIAHGAAGSGKSTALSQWVDSLDLAGEELLWVTLHADDAGVLAFWDRIGDALTRHGLATEESPNVHPTPNVRLLALATPLTLVLDDYHLVESPAIDAQLRALVVTAPLLRLVVGTRTTGALHSLELAARVSTRVLTSETLAFTRDESRALLEESGLGGSEALADTIHDATLGWPLASQALLVEAQRDPSSAALISSVGEHRSRFVDEIVTSTLSAKDSSDRELLHRLALADEYTIEIAAELAERPVDWVRTRLDEFEGNGVGTWQSRSGVLWFRMHPLLLEAFARSSAASLDIATSQRVRGLLSDRLVKSRPLRALELAFSIQDWARMERIVLLHYARLMYYNSPQVLAMLHGVPRSAMRAHPEMLGAELSQEYGTQASADKLTSMLAIIDANRRPRDLNTGVHGAAAEIMNTGVHRLFGEMGTALRSADRAIEILHRTAPAEQVAEGQAVPVIYLQAAITQIAAGHYSRGLDGLVRGRDIALERGAVGEQFQAVSLTAMAEALRGSIPGALEWIGRSEEAAPYDGWLGGYLGGGYDVARAYVALDRWDLEGARTALEALKPREPWIEYWPYIAFAQAQHDLIAHGAAEAHARLAATFARKRWRPTPPQSMLAPLVAVRAELLSISGQPVRAEEELRAARVEGAHVDLARARLALVRGEHLQAMALADAVAWSSEDNPRLRAEALLAVASVALESDQQHRALDTFVEAAHALTEHALRIPLLTVPHERLTTLVELARTSGKDIDYTMFEQVPELHRHSVSVVPLSKAERRVLQALSSTGSVEDAAAALHLSAHTVRYHVKRTYKKLGVTTRTDAITRAQELGMLDIP